MPEYLNDTHYRYEELLDSDHLRRLNAACVTEKIWLGYKWTDESKTRGAYWQVIGHVKHEKRLVELIKETGKKK